MNPSRIALAVLLVAMSTALPANAKCQKDWCCREKDGEFDSDPCSPLLHTEKIKVIPLLKIPRLGAAPMPAQ